MDKTEYSPIEITETQVVDLVLKHFGIKGKVRRLQGEVDLNYYMKSVDGEEITIKISRPGTAVDAIKFQSAVISHLSSSGFPLCIPELMFSRNGKDIVTLDGGSFLRLQKWVPGSMLSEVNPRSPQLLSNWGRVCGLLSKHLIDFDHPFAHRFYKWNPSESLYSKKYRSYIHNEEGIEIADYFWKLFEEEALPQLAGLRKSVNYNDAHEHNLLVDNNLSDPEIYGVIDFGDALFTETINELAIGCAYVAMYLPDPLQALARMVKGYHEVFELEEEEIKVLFPLIAARLLITVANAAWNKHKEPENEYLLISEKPAWDLLRKLRTISPAFAHYTFRYACGLEPHPSRSIFHNWVASKKEEFIKVVEFNDEDVVTIDLSVGSLELGNNSNFENIKSFQKTIDRLLEDKGGKFGIGGYGETRPFYTTEAYRTEGNEGARWRTVHLGIDIWGKADTPVLSAWEGTIYSFQDNSGDCDYGPTIILEHIISDELTFYTLYGHLSMESLDGKSIGMPVSKGEKIAKIGSPPINGNWPPHLHFQVMLDLMGNHGDFPGVAFPKESEVWLSVCPEGRSFSYPDSILNEIEKDENNDQKILATRKEKLGKSLSISYNRPLHIVRGYKQYLYDTTGRRYLDTVNNVAHVGHEHPRIVKAAQRQMGVLNTNTRYLHKNISVFAEELLTTFPPELSVVHFVNSGSEANELALRMVKAYTGQRDMIAVEVGYHGNTGGCIGISSYKFDGKGGMGAPSQTHVVPIPDTYRGLYRDHSTAGNKYADHVKEAIININKKGHEVGGFISESILSCGGQIVLPDNYLKEAYEYVHSAGGLCIADEVQVGFGRVGEAFWGFELHGVIPDIVTLGKPIGNGHPLAAVITTQKVAEAFSNGMEYFNTFGGNPVSCAIGLEVLRVIEEEGLQAHALEVGNYLIQNLKELQSQFQIIGDVRGNGLFLGFELIKNRDTLEPATKEAGYLANRMRDRGVLMSTDGPFNNVLKIKPPMCFNKFNADILLENLNMVLKEDFLKL